MQDGEHLVWNVKIMKTPQEEYNDIVEKVLNQANAKYEEAAKLIREGNKIIKDTFPLAYLHHSLELPNINDKFNESLNTDDLVAFNSLSLYLDCSDILAALEEIGIETTTTTTDGWSSSEACW